MFVLHLRFSTDNYKIEVRQDTSSAYLMKLKLKLHVSIWTRLCSGFPQVMKHVEEEMYKLLEEQEN